MESMTAFEQIASLGLMAVAVGIAVWLYKARQRVKSGSTSRPGEDQSNR